jgi:hypothetical protein
METKEIYICEGVEMEFFTLEDKLPNEREMVTLVLKPRNRYAYGGEMPCNKAGNQIISASVRLFKKVPPKFTVRSHYSTLDITADEVLYWGRIKQD